LFKIKNIKSIIEGEKVEDFAEINTAPQTQTAEKSQTISIEPDRVILNGMHIRTYLIKDFPKEAVPGILYAVTHGRHMDEPGIAVNLSMHMKPYNFKYDWWTATKIDRLQQNIESSYTGKWRDTAREEEKEAAQALLHFVRSLGRDTCAEVWITVSVTARDEKSLKKCCKAFEDELQIGGGMSFKLNRLEYEQHIPLQDAAVLACADNTVLAKRYTGRVMDRDALSALYPFLDGSITDYRGCYIGHRIFNASAVYKDFTAGDDNKNIIVTGSSGSGKSTWIKGLIVSLLIEGFKIYVFDMDGEYYNLCRAVNGVWVDYTAGTGRYVDPTIIEPPISDEINFNELDGDTREKAKAADNSRFSESVANTRALISLLSRDFEKDVERQNALSMALMLMWKEAGISKNKPETWHCEGISRDKVSLHALYGKIKHLAREDDGAKRLQTDLWTYFEGADTDLFTNADDGKWIKDAPLVVFHVAQSADNPIEEQVGAIKIVSTTHMTWQQIKRDRIKSERYSVEIFDEWQRLSKNRYAKTPVYRSITTGRKYNDQVILGFNDPAVLFRDADGESIWNNSKYKIFFRLEENSIRKFAESANMYPEIVEEWLSLPQHAFIFRETTEKGDAYDILRMELPPSEIQKISKTRGIKA